MRVRVIGSSSFYHRSPLESIGVGEFRLDHHFLETVVFTIGAHWSPLKLEIIDEGKSNLIKKLLFIGAHWSPLESIGVGEFRWDQHFL